MIDPATITYPPGLPISARREEIINLIKRHQVLIIAGETGSGKTTQIPKFCIEAGRGIEGRIACTQPRRIAAVSVASRIAEELKEPLGTTVGYQIRFSDKTEKSTVIKLMTDGILLSEAQRDPLLKRYDTIIIDEAHERSLNIDFILGLLKRLIRTRKNLKVIITSATIDTKKFSKAFDNAPIIEVSGRTYPVEVRYRPPEASTSGTAPDSYVEVAAVETLSIIRQGLSGDILVFMPTEQDIRDTCDILEHSRLPETLILPLYARMPSSRQRSIFAPTHERKIIVATNIAETSITIPGVTCVVDTGLARISSYSPATRTNALPVTPVSRSSADQRAGRCGRVSNGVCIRLYSEDDYRQREQYTVPEILRSNLAEVLLRMIALRVKDIEHFPFVDPPAKRAIHDGVNLLTELGAIRKDKKHKGRYELTKTGSFMAFLPLDPRISRILIEGNYQGCIREMAILAAVLSIQDPKERPLDKQKEADQAHRDFKDPCSDLMTYLNMWDAYHEHWRATQSKSKMRAFCQDTYLSYKRMTEWRDIHLQITSMLKEQGFTLPTTRLSKTPVKKQAVSPFYAAVHRSFLAGYLSNIAERKEKHYYTAAKNKECMIFPGSGVFSNPPAWITAAEMVRTSRLFARTVAAIEPDWILQFAGALKQHSYRSVHWSFEREEVVAIRQTRVYGLTVEGDKEVGYGQLHPAAAGTIFNETVLVENADRYQDRFPFLAANNRVIRDILDMEQRLRRRDIYTGTGPLLDFYNRHISGVSSIRALQKLIETRGDSFLYIRKEDFMLYVPDEQEMALFPETGTIGDEEYRLVYTYRPDEPDDGVTVVIGEQQAADLRAGMADWLVPGLLREKIRCLIKGLPKDLRRQLVPVNQSAEHLFQLVPQKAEKPLTQTLGELIYREFDTYVPPDAWNEKDLPPHLLFRYRIQSLDGKPLRETRDLSALSDTGPSKKRVTEFSILQKKIGKTGLTAWDREILNEEIQGRDACTAYQAWEPVSLSAVNLKLYLDREEAREVHARGIAVLAYIQLKDILATFRQELLFTQSWAKKAMYYGGLKTLNEGMWHALIMDVLSRPIYTKTEFLDFLEGIRGEIFPRMSEARDLCRRVIETYTELRAMITGLFDEASGMPRKQDFLKSRLEDLRTCIPQTFYETKPLSLLSHKLRYAQCIGIRARKGAVNPVKDEENACIIEPFQQWYAKALASLPVYAGKEKKEKLAEFNTALEELRIQVFAQEMKTAVKVSPKRLAKLIEEYEGLK
ncbi:MAG: ATP-dependent RNA helicase HrpA [Spirochaetales bacterium]|nr:ATP-dependent RNA helicase HrpA [Spirochaetales bacterium]